MAFRTNIVPAIEERTVSGSSVSFNSAFALPLKACKVSFSATESGSGEPSPINIRPYIPVEYVNITANGNINICDLLEGRGGGTLDVVNKEIEISDDILTMTGSESWRYAQSNAFHYCTVDKTNFYVSYGSVTFSNGIIGRLYQNGTLRVYPSDNPQYVDASTDMSELMANGINTKYKCISEIIPLSDMPTLSTIIGNNTIFADTGDVDLTYKDLDIAKRGSFREVFRLPS